MSLDNQNKRNKEMATESQEIDELVARGYLAVPPETPGDPVIVLDRDGNFFKEFPAAGDAPPPSEESSTAGAVLESEELSLFDVAEYEPWREHWKEMPEFSQEDLSPAYSVIVNFASLTDLEAFSRLIAQRVGPKTRSIWYPEAEIGRYANKRYVQDES